MNYDSFKQNVSLLVDELLGSTSVDQVSGLMQYLFSEDSFLAAVEYAKQSKESKKEVAEVFRESFAPIFSKCGFLNHFYTKPLGYAGDYQIFEYLYDRVQHKDTPEDYLHFDQYVFSLSLYQSIIERKEIIRLLLERELKKNAELSICSIGCGGGRELVELGSQLNQASITLIDFDERALTFSKERVNSHAGTIDTICMEASQWNLDENQKYDIMYCLGLLDYVTAPVVNRMFRRSVRHLSQNGQFIFALKDSTQFNADFYYYLSNVEFVPYDVEDGIAFAEKHNLTVNKIIPSESRAINIFVCTHAEA